MKNLLKNVNWNLVIALVVLLSIIFYLVLLQADFSNHYSDIICK